MARGIREIMNQNNNSVEADRVEMLDSLMQAVFDAGGNPQLFFNKVIKENITVVELIDALAQNKVRFVYNGDKK